MPNQINQPTQQITNGELFTLEGINVVRVRVLDQVKIMIEGLNPLKEKIIKLLGKLAVQIYFQHENSYPNDMANVGYYLIIFTRFFSTIYKFMSS